MAGRVRHPIDTKALERYISENVPEIKVPLDVKQFGFGQSNPTYLLTSPDGTSRYVLRKKPPGRLLSKAAHKVEREYRIITALSSSSSGASAVPVPRTHVLCEDPAILGTPFYIMSFVAGRIFEDAAMPSASSASERAALWRAAVVALAALHSVDADAVGLGSFGQRGGFYDRQLATWRTICEAQAATPDAGTGRPVGQLPRFDELLAFFAAPGQRPPDRSALVHGDYKIDNLVFHATEPRVVGILDWEMSTVGHPLSDLANLMHPFYSASMATSSSSSPTSTTPDTSSSSSSASSASTSVSNPAFLPGATPGLPDASTVLSWYASAAGWDPTPDMEWAAAFSAFRLSAICQGIAARVATRQASSASAREHAAAMGPLAEFAWELVVRRRRRRGEEGEGEGEKEKEAGTREGGRDAVAKL